MKKIRWLSCIIFLVGFLLIHAGLDITFFSLPSTHAASTNPDLLKAKEEAEAKGYIFLNSRDEILTRARKEGQLGVIYGTGEPETIKGIVDSFVKKYPFITIKRLEDGHGADYGPRILMELQHGTATTKECDVIYLVGNFYAAFFPYVAKYDLLGMAQKGLLQIPAQMIDPQNRNVLAAGSALDAIAYNPKIFPAKLVPNTWTDLLRPELKGRKFIMDIAPAAVAALEPAWGLEKVLQFARGVKEQDPIWGRGHSRMLTGLIAGEYGLHGGTNYHTAIRLVQKAPDSIQVVLAEPVPTRLHETEGILRTAVNPHAALLWLEHMASPEAQKYLDEAEPLKSSIFAPGSRLKKVVEGKKISVAGWRYFMEREEIEKKVLDAYGFPTAQIK